MKQSWYLLLIQFSSSEPLIDRLQKDVPVIDKGLTILSDGAYKLVSRSDTGHVCAWVLRTRASEQQISNIIDDPDAGRAIPDNEKESSDYELKGSLRPADKLLIFKLSDQPHVWNMNVIRDWIRRHWDLD